MNLPRQQHSGVLVVDKPSGPSSFQIVAGARRVFGTRAVGHCGTLDPLASGVLVVVLGEATKLSGYLTQADKAYRARIQFGMSTDTLDALGQPTEQRSLQHGWSGEADLSAALAQERERSAQLPPQFSAIKLDGQRAYARARAGQSTELAARSVKLTALQVLSFDDGGLELELEASKGYYVRSLVRDVCTSLGVPGHLAALRRLRSGCFTLAEAHAWPPQGAPSLITLAECVQRAMPCARLTAVGEVRAHHGKLLEMDHFSSPPADAACAWLSELGELIAIGERDGAAFRVVRGFRSH